MQRYDKTTTVTTCISTNAYAGLHRPGSEAVYRYTSLELKDRYELLKAALGER
jgi:hypothetical protein